MDTNELKQQIAGIEEEMNALPRGSISTKKVNGHLYYYHRWYEGKTKKERFIPEEELEQLQGLVATLFDLVREYSRQLDVLKRRKNALAFSDLERLTVRLLAVPDEDQMHQAFLWREEVSIFSIGFSE